MKQLKLALMILFIVVALLFAVGQIYNYYIPDTRPPMIICGSDRFFVSTSYTEAELLAGVTAYDTNDGNITDQIVVRSISPLISNDTAKVTYVVFDQAGNMASATRLMTYIDYRKPTFELRRSLSYSLNEAVSLHGRIYASDVIDGNITNSIRITYTDIVSSSEGIYSLQVQVTNSMGDTSMVTLPVLIQAADASRPRIILDKYLVTLKVGDPFDPISVVTHIKDGANTISADKVTVENGVDLQTPGSYTVKYTYRNADGSIGTTLLAVIVEE